MSGMSSLWHEYKALPTLMRFVVRLVLITIPALVVCYFVFWNDASDEAPEVGVDRGSQLQSSASASDEPSPADAGPEYPAKQLNRDIVRSVNRYVKQNGMPDRATSADCEDMAVVKKGSIADCTVTFKSGTEEYVRVTMQDDKGHFIFEAM